MGGHFFALALVHLVQGVLALLGWAVLALLAFAGSTAVALEDVGGGILTGTLFTFLLTGGFLLFVLPELLCGWWMLSRKPAGRILGIILAVLYLPAMPLHTLLGVWSLWALLSEEGAREYSRGLR